MLNWDWLTKPAQQDNWRFAGRVLLKAIALFIVLNMLFALLNPFEALGRISVYNVLVEGRVRLPYGETQRAYNLSLNSLSAMFSSHKLAMPKADDEYRVLLVGDSSVWGILLRPDETLSAYLNALNIVRDDGRRVIVYNIGYPTMSLTKDLLLLEEALNYHPDHILWLTTLQSFPRHTQTSTPLVANNAPRVRDLIERYSLNLPTNDLIERDWRESTLIGQRRALADWWRLQMFGMAWQTTNIDQFYGDFTLRSNDFAEDDTWDAGLIEITLDEALFGLDVIATAHQMVADRLGEDVPITLVNEPIFIADGANSDLRYNFWYPRWAYDDYRNFYEQVTDAYEWHYLDLWDAIAPDEFTDSPVHLTPAGSSQLADLLAQVFVSPP